MCQTYFARHKIKKCQQIILKLGKITTSKNNNLLLITIVFPFDPQNIEYTITWCWIFEIRWRVFFYIGSKLLDSWRMSTYRKYSSLLRILSTPFWILSALDNLVRRIRPNHNCCLYKKNYLNNAMKLPSWTNVIIFLTLIKYTSLKWILY